MIQRTNKTPIINVAQAFGREAPQAFESEAGVIGLLILEPALHGDVVEIIGPDGEMFLHTAHVALWQAIHGIISRGDKLTIHALTQWLRESEALEQVGGVDRLMVLAESVAAPTPAMARHYAGIMRETYGKRKLVETCTLIVEEIYTQPDTLAEHADRAESRIMATTEAMSQTTTDVASLGAVLDDVWAKLERGPEAGDQVPTGFFDVDEILGGGLHDGEMVIVAARPSMGKSQWALDTAAHGAERGHPIAFFSLEMSREQIGNRLLSSMSGVDSTSIRTRQIRQHDWDDLERARDRIASMPMFIIDTPNMSMHAIRGEARRLKQRKGIRAVYIDYLQLITGPRRDNREQEVSEISRQVKGLARELKIPVVCLAQVNRGPMAREGHRPRMSDLRESGAIEQDADAIVLLHREDYYHIGETNYERTGQAEVIVAKQRNGPTGTVFLHWDSEHVRFQNAARQGGMYQ